MATKTEATSLKMTPEVRDLWEKCAQAECKTACHKPSEAVKEAIAQTKKPRLAGLYVRSGGLG